MKGFVFMKFRNTLLLFTSALLLCLFLSGCGRGEETTVTSTEEVITMESLTQETEVLTDALNRENYHTELFGENVYLFSPEDDMEEVQSILNRLWNKQETNQFGDDRIAVYFLPGDYPEELSVKVGYYMQVAGLGSTPDAVSLAHLDCTATWLGDDSNHNATCNFWRGVENLSVRNNVMWAVSQATFMRQVHLEGALFLHDNYGWASGGFLANSKIDKLVDSGSQQQWLSRNTDWLAWNGENWNMVFAGIGENKAPAGTWPGTKYTTLPTVERIREKPYLAYDSEQGFGVLVPAWKEDSAGASWGEDSFLPMDTFYVAKAGVDTAESLNTALSEGKHLFLTPGIYDLDAPLMLEQPGTICLGTGLATLRPTAGNACIQVADHTPVILAGLLFDAGQQPSDFLLQVGIPSDVEAELENSPATASESEATASDGYTLLADLFFRVGGSANYDTAVDCCVEIAQDHVLGDNFWVWRADHGDGVGWEQNKAANGIHVTGDDVTIYALMVEHFQEYQTIWDGNDGKVIFYQSEIPYDVPRQEVWKSHDGEKNGYASYKVGDEVTSHEAWGLGIYLYNRDAIVELRSAMEVPENASGIKVHNICTVMLTGNPGLSHIINESGEPVYHAGERSVITEWPME